MGEAATYYRDDLALIHDRGFGFHGDRCAPGILTELEPIRARGGLVLELGCGSGHLTRHLVDAGCRVIATDASPSMLALARHSVGGVESLEQLVLPDAPLPQADAIVSVGHVLNYLPDEDAIYRALIAAAGALRPGGILVLDLQDLRWGESYQEAPSQVRVEDDWVLISEFEVPDRSTFVRRHISFVRTEESAWRRDEEVHRNVLLDTSAFPELLAGFGLDVRIGTAFGDEELPAGLMTLIGRKAD